MNKYKKLLSNTGLITLGTFPLETILGEDRAEACKRIIQACTDRKA